MTGQFTPAEAGKSSTSATAAEIAPGVIEGPTELEKVALETQNEIKRLSMEAQFTFIEMGRLLKQAKDEAHWSTLRCESFKAYIEELELPVEASYSWATRLIGIYEVAVLQLGKTPQELAEMGVAKLSRLLPVARRGDLTDELWDKAREMTDLDLRIELGYVLPEKDMVEGIQCPHCGAWVAGARWAVKGKQTGSHSGGQK